MKLTTLCYIKNNNKYLMLYRNKKKNDLNQGKWIGVGGKFEENETPAECVVREVLEETGLTLNSYEFRGVVTFISDKWETEYMFLFTSENFSGDIRECNEGELRWIDEDEVLNLPTWEGDHYFLERLLKNEKDIMIKLEYHGDNLIKVT